MAPYIWPCRYLRIFRALKGYDVDLRQIAQEFSRSWKLGALAGFNSSLKGPLIFARSSRLIPKIYVGTNFRNFAADASKLIMVLSTWGTWLDLPVC